jgi:hypothetical protein
MDNIPPEIYAWVQEKVDEGHLQTFLAEYNEKKYENFADFINGFTLAITFIYRERFTQQERKWVRISTSLILANALTGSSQ